MIARFLPLLLLPCLLALPVYNEKDLKVKPTVAVSADFIKNQDNSQMFESLLNMSEKFFVSMNNETLQALFDYVETEVNKKMQNIKTPSFDMNITLESELGIGDIFNYSSFLPENVHGSRRLLENHSSHPCNHHLCKAWNNFFAYVNNINKIVSGLKNH